MIGPWGAEGGLLAGSTAVAGRAADAGRAAVAGRMSRRLFLNAMEEDGVPACVWAVVEGVGVQRACLWGLGWFAACGRNVMLVQRGWHDLVRLGGYFAIQQVVVHVDCGV